MIKKSKLLYVRYKDVFYDLPDSKDKTYYQKIFNLELNDLRNHERQEEHDVDSLEAA